MSDFTNHPEPLHLYDISYVLRAPLRWEIGCKGSGLWLIVPTGFAFDVSVPRGLRWLVNPHDRRLLLAAALHDFTVEQRWEWQTSAALWHHGLRAFGVPSGQAYVLYAAVSIFTFFRASQ